MTRGNDGNPTKMFPDRIENVIYSHKDVDLCCVIGIADKERINYPRAYVVIKGKADKETVKHEILNICKQKLPIYMIPEEIVFVDNLPRTSRGKIDYRALEEQIMK